MMDREEARVRRSTFLMRDAGLREYLQSLACKLGGDHCADTRVYPLRTPWFNASMAPNGMMQVWSGLLLRVENEAQLAGILGHELGHYLQRHSLARLRDARSRSAFMALMSPFGVAGLVGQVAAAAGGAAYSREAEIEADVIGITLMRRAGYDARELARVWDNLRQELKVGAAGDPAQRSVMMATHPGVDDRQARMARLAGDAGGEMGASAYHARIDPYMADLIDDELKRAQYDETIALMTRLAEGRPQRGDLRYARGEAHRLRGGAGDPERALDELQQALALQAPPVACHRSIGLLHRQQGRPAEAAAAFARYLEAAPLAADAALIRSYLDETKT
jgi:beta-barrel assembly-enhancing protease